MGQEAEQTRRDINDAINLAKLRVLNPFADVSGDDRRIARNYLLNALVDAHDLERTSPEEAAQVMERLRGEWNSPAYWNPIGGQLDELDGVDALVRKLSIEEQRRLVTLDLDEKIEVLHGLQV